MNHVTVIPCQYVVDEWSINKNLLIKFKNKHPEKDISKYIVPVVYYLKDGTVLVSYRTYSLLKQGK
jgi:hypothetical protein